MKPALPRAAKLRSLALRIPVLAATLPLFALTGCSLLNLLNQPSSPADITGNWSFAVNPSAGTAPVPAFIGALASQGSSITGVLHGATCVDPSLDIAFTGTLDDSGNLTLTSSNLPNNVATLTTTMSSIAGITSATGTIVINGTGPCATASVPVIGGEFQPNTGTYAGTLTSAGISATVTASLTQGAANADGNFPESGTLTLTTPTCTDTLTVTGLILGPTLSATFASAPSTPAATGIGIAILTPLAGSLNLSSGLTIVSPSCNPGTFTGTLTKQ